MYIVNMAHKITVVASIERPIVFIQMTMNRLRIADRLLINHHQPDIGPGKNPSLHG